MFIPTYSALLTHALYSGGHFFFPLNPNAFIQCSLEINVLPVYCAHI